MLGERRRPGEKLFEGWRVFLILKLLRLVTGIEIILKLTSEIDLFKSVSRSLRCKLLTCFQARSLRIRVGSKLRFSLWQKSCFRFTLTSPIRRRRAQIGRCGFYRGRRKILQLATTGHVIEYLLGHLLRFFLRGDFFEYGILVQWLLDQVGQLESSHLQHLDPLPQLRR